MSTLNPVDSNGMSVAAGTTTQASEPTEGGVLRLHAEDLHVSKEQVEIAAVDVSTRTKTREVLVSEELAREGVEVTTVPVGRRIDAMPAIRQEGDVTIVPVVEEIVVVERRLMLKEELHVRRVRSTHRHEETVTLRYQEAEVVRRPLDGATGNDTKT